MGYTHYWYQTRSLTPPEWQDFLTAARPLVAGHNCYIGDAYEWARSAGPHLVLETDCETLEISQQRPPDRSGTRRLDPSEPEGYFRFCKTNRSPRYDPIVVGVLKALQAAAPDAITLRSDGGAAVFA